MWKVGDRVEIVKSSKRGADLGMKGTVVYIGLHQGRIEFLIEFDDDMGGHKGASINYDGKDGHCWWVFEESQEVAAKGPITVKKINKRKNNYY